MNKEEWSKNVIIVSGGFDPVHKGHIRMFREASYVGANVIVGLNSDEWLSRKKGKPFMSWSERAEILESCKFITQVLPMDDYDDTASDIIERVVSLYEQQSRINSDNMGYNIYFANGGDRKKGNVPELDVCKYLGVVMLWGIGGGKIQSSSWITNGGKDE